MKIQDFSQLATYAPTPTFSANAAMPYVAWNRSVFLSIALGRTSTLRGKHSLYSTTIAMACLFEELRMLFRRKRWTAIYRVMQLASFLGRQNVILARRGC